MAINIKDPETDAAARELARVTGETLTEAVRRAIRERHTRVMQQQRRRRAAGKAQSYLERAQRLPKLDETSLEDLLYGDDGLPA